MTDISMCQNKDCPKKDTCFRHQAPVNPYGWQAYGDFKWDKDKGCEYYWKITKEKE